MRIKKTLMLKVLGISVTEMSVEVLACHLLLLILHGFLGHLLSGSNLYYDC